MPNKSQTNLVTTEPEISSNGVGHSTQTGRESSNQASALELARALEESQKTNAILLQKVEALEAKMSQTSDSDISKLASAISALQQPKAPVVANPDNLNRSQDFMNAQNVDGKSMMEAQSTCQDYRNEHKKPIQIPRTYQSDFGPALAITVNGVRVSIPCDGREYFINETHWLHAKERMAKVDALKGKADANDVVIE